MTFQIQVQLFWFQNDSIKNTFFKLFFWKKYGTSPLSSTPFFTSRPNNQNSNAQWHDFSLHCLLLFKRFYHVIDRVTRWWWQVSTKNVAHILSPCGWIRYLSCHGQLSNLSLLEKVCYAPYKTALMGYHFESTNQESLFQPIRSLRITNGNPAWSFLPVRDKNLLKACRPIQAQLQSVNQSVAWSPHSSLADSINPDFSQF